MLRDGTHTHTHTHKRTHRHTHTHTHTQTHSHTHTQVVGESSLDMATSKWAGRATKMPEKGGILTGNQLQVLVARDGLRVKRGFEMHPKSYLRDSD